MSRPKLGKISRTLTFTVEGWASIQKGVQSTSHRNTGAYLEDCHKTRESYDGIFEDIKQNGDLLNRKMDMVLQNFLTAEDG